LPLPSQKPFRHNNSCCVSYFNDVYRTNHHGKPHRKNIGGRAFIAKTFKKVALIPYLRDRWLTCETWASAIKWHSTEAVNFDVNSGSVSSSLSRDNELSNYADRYKPGENDTGYFKVVWDHTHFYYVCKPGNHIERPKLTTRWYDKVMTEEASLKVALATVPRRISVRREEYLRPMKRKASLKAGSTSQRDRSRFCGSVG
jgi:hypothetical protein